MSITLPPPMAMTSSQPASRQFCRFVHQADRRFLHNVEYQASNAGLAQPLDQGFVPPAISAHDKQSSAAHALRQIGKELG